MIDINDILSVLQEKNPGVCEIVLKAYNLAEEAHRGVFRESGDPYITHPLNVAKNLLDMEIYDEDTICAALLHDVVEDTSVTLDDISKIINPTVAELVDGVTKIRKMNYSTKEEEALANTRKIVNGLNKDVRIILIKLADRLHNMRTLQYKKPEKQQANAIETMELFVPFATSIGAYQIKSQLEDLALMYLKPDDYKRICEKRDELAIKEKEYLAVIRNKLIEILKTKDIPNEIIIRTMNICNIYQRVSKGYEMDNIYDLFYLKILVNEVEDCYRTLLCVHRNTPPIHGRFKDYIFSPRTNHYQSLHTTVTDKNGKIIKTKIRTFDMDKVSAFGVSAYWNLKEGKPEEEIPHRKTHEETQEDIRNNSQFAKTLKEIQDSSKSDYDFFQEIKKQLLTEHIYPVTHSGVTVELPVGSTAYDFACRAYPEAIDSIKAIIVNGKQCNVYTELKNNDRVQIKTDGKIRPEDWEKPNSTINKIKSLVNRQKR